MSFRLLHSRLQSDSMYKSPGLLLATSQEVISRGKQKQKEEDVGLEFALIPFSAVQFHAMFSYQRL